MTRTTHPTDDRHIEIRVRYHRDCRGGGVHAWARFPASVRGLGQAIDAFASEAREAVACLGNIGCAGVWVSVEGVALDTLDVESLRRAAHAEMRADFARDGMPQPTRTADLTRLLAAVRSGEYARRRRAIEQALAAVEG